MAPVGKRVPITITPGTNPEPDNTDNTNSMLVDSDGIYFTTDGQLRAMEGNSALTFDTVAPTSTQASSLAWNARYVQSFATGTEISGIETHTIIGTASAGGISGKMYHLDNSDALYNITPVSTTTVAVANSLDNEYQRSLSNNALSTTIGTTSIVVSDTAHPYAVGNIINISGASTFGGFSSGNINKNASVTAVTTNTWTYAAGATATSTTSGGGASIVATSGLIKINKASHGISAGSRIEVAGSTSVGGVNAGFINGSHIVTSATTNAFYISTTDMATSSVTSGGGASTTYQGPSNDFYYGDMSGDIFGDEEIVLTNGGHIYEWDFTTTAPTIISGAPAPVNYIFVSHDQVCALGRYNRFRASDRGDKTVWTPGATNLAFDDNIEGIAALISHAPSGELDLLFTPEQVVIARYVGLPQIWSFDIQMKNDGIISQNARVCVETDVFWCGNDDFYQFSGGAFSTLPNNYLKKYFKQRLNRTYKNRIFAFHIPNWRAIGWTFPINTTYGGSDTDGALVWESILYNYDSKFWYLDDSQTVFRQAAEQFAQSRRYPLFIDARYSASTQNAGEIYNHAVDGTVRGFDFRTKFEKIAEGDYTMDIHQLVADSVQVGGNIDITYITKEEAQSSSTISTAVSDVTPTDTLRDVNANGRHRQIRVQSDTGLTTFAMGQWFEIASRGAPR